MMDGMDDLVQFLRARLDEDEQIAQAAADGLADGTSAPAWHMEEPCEGQRHWEVWGDEGAGQRLVHGKGRRAESVHIARHDPARVLAEVDAKRQIIGMHNIPAVVSPKMAALGLREGESPEDDRRCAGCGLDQMDDPITPDVSECPILRALALPYADHPDYRDEWRPPSS